MLARLSARRRGVPPTRRSRRWWSVDGEWPVAAHPVQLAQSVDGAFTVQSRTPGLLKGIGAVLVGPSFPNPVGFMLYFGYRNQYGITNAGPSTGSWWRGYTLTGQSAIRGSPRVASRSNHKPGLLKGRRGTSASFNPVGFMLYFGYRNQYGITNAEQCRTDSALTDGPDAGLH